MKLWVIGLACATGLVLGLYFLGSGIFDLCYDVGPIRPEACASGAFLGTEDFSLVGIGIILVMVSPIVLASVVRKRGSLESSSWVVWFVRSVYVIGAISGVLILYGSLDGICDPYGPFGTTGTLCTSFDPYEAMGPLLAVVSFIGLISAFITQRTSTQNKTPKEITE